MSQLLTGPALISSAVIAAVMLKEYGGDFERTPL
jgi:hypothetical protein